MPSINSIYRSLESLAQAEGEVVQSFASSTETAQNGKNTASTTLHNAVQLLVTGGDNDRYAALTRAAKTANAQVDFTGLVASWTQADDANRKERADLETKWGTRQVVAQNAAKLNEDIGIIRSAIAETAPEIKTFDDTTKHISEHNAKYPKAQINEDNHHGFEKFKLGRFLLWLTFINRGPHKAYQIVHDYEKKYGDYFEDARNISKLRSNEAKLEGNLADKQQSYNDTAGAGSRMDQLDGSYRGVEGIARDVRSLVRDLLVKSPAFGEALANEVKGVDAQGATLSAAKIRSFDVIESTLQTQSQHASQTLEQLTEARDYLSQATSRVGSETVFFDTDGLERSVAHADRISRATVRDANEALASITGYAAPANAGLPDMEKALNGFTDAKPEDNRLSLDFTSLKSSVSSAVDAYEREQQRIREAEEAAARERARIAAAAAAAIQIAADREERRSDTFNTTVREERRSSDDDISIGSQGTQERQQDDISQQNDGISP